MHPIVHSTSLNNLKSKWSVFKTWFSPDVTKRRPSACSTASNESTNSTSSHYCGQCCCCHRQQHKASPSEHRLMVRCISSFRRRSSNASTETSESNQEQLMQQQYYLKIDEEEKKLKQLFTLAEEEVYCAKVSHGSAYYMGDRIAAKEAIEDYIQKYRSLLSHLDQSHYTSHYISNHQSTFNSEASYLKRAYDKLPKHNKADVALNKAQQLSVGLEQDKVIICKHKANRELQGDKEKQPGNNKYTIDFLTIEIYHSGLPTDLLLIDIFESLDAPSLIQLSLVSKQLYYLVNDEALWKQRCIQDFNISQDNTYRYEGWKAFYQALKCHTKVYTWGTNHDERLGLPDYQNDSDLPTRPMFGRYGMRRRIQHEIPEPHEVTALKKKSVIDIVAGGWSFHALDITGTVWTWGTLMGEGRSRDGRGYIQHRHYKLPTELQANNSTQPKIKFRSISSGRSHVIGLAKNDVIWHWTNPNVLQRVDLDIACRVVQVVANWSYSSVLTERGELYIVPEPDIVSLSEEQKEEPPATQVIDSGVTLQQILPSADPDDQLVQLAGLDKYTLALTRHGLVLKLKTVDSTRFSLSPQEHVTVLDHFSSQQQEVNDRRGIMRRFITGHFLNFAVYTKDRVMLGTVDAQEDTRPNCLEELEHKDICKVSFGDYHFGAITSKGKLLTWGSYSGGALGHGKDLSQQQLDKPTMVESLSDRFVFAIGFGGWHSGVLAIE
ncbi:regulator of chromosome condensation 1/beta-lactamase-inhibitor protein II [Blakeslea trispora]|nr:regulator of chromosome condensation 1/beta-lactamase-inhibitor protein II [Blakeslea trispora]